jgi:hypothetical protein
VSREPDAVTICCSFVPANCPSIVCVIEEGGCIVSEYMNMLEVAAMLPDSTALGYGEAVSITSNQLSFS